MDEMTDNQSGAMDDVRLLGIIESFESESYGFSTGDLANQRAYAIQRYLAEPYGDEVDGRSSVVDTGLRDTIEWAIPQILRVFLSGDEIAEFAATGPEDEAAARLETQYVNHVMLEKNDAFNVFSTWFRDAMMSKVGYVKAYWETRQDVLQETYEGLTPDAMAVISSDPAVQIVEDRAYPDPYYQSPPMPAPDAMQQGMTPQAPPPAPMLHDIKVRRLHQCGNVKIDNVPPEEIRVHRSLRTISMQDALFVQHSAQKTVSELRQDGIDIPDGTDGDVGADPSNDMVEEARDRFADDSDFEGNSADPSTRMVWVRESYLRVDYDGDGIAELRKVMHVGRLILSNDPCDMIPFAAVTPIIFPHKHIGIGFDDLCDMPSQVSTAIQRQYLDNLYLQNNGRYGVDVNTVNVDDMLVSRPGGIVRSDGNPANGIFPFTHPALGQSALEGMNWATNWRQTSTGVFMDSANISPDVLNNSTATGVSQALSAQQSRIEAVTRSFAAGVKDLCEIVHALTLKNATAAEKVKINREWITVDPREWIKRTSMTITVGLGSGTKEMKVAQLQSLAGLQAQGLQSGTGIVTPANLYATGKRITQEMGYRNADEFWTDPSKVEPPPPQKPPQVMVEEMKQQGEQQKMQATMQADAQKFQATQQADVQKFQAEQQAKQAQIQLEAQAKAQEQAHALELQRSNDQRQAELDALQHQRELQRMAMEDQFKRDQMAQEYAFKQWEAELNAKTQMQTAAQQVKPEKADKSNDSMAAIVAAALAPKKATKNSDGSWSSRIDN